MTLTFDWFLPTSGDGRTIYGRGHSLPIAQAQALPIPGDRPPDIEYLGQVAGAAQQLGFAAVLTPTGTWCEDAWLATAALITQTSRLKFLVAFRPGLISPTLAAQMAASYQRISRGRLLLNVVTGGQAEEQRRFGDHLSHDERYARTGEFLAIVRGAWSEQPFDFSGRHYQVEQATVMRPPDPVPGIYFGGSSAAAGPVAARYVDTYLTWGEPPAQVAEKLAWMRGLAAAEGRGGAGTALVGSHAQVADLIEEYAALGISEFILSGYPHLEEAYWFGEGVLPELRRRGRWAPPPLSAVSRELEEAGRAR